MRMAPPAHAALDRLYGSLPKLSCQRKCQASCGPIVMSRVEWQRIIAAVGYEPKGKDLTCPLLDRRTGDCRVYRERPALCRLWGLVRAMACPWGCVPERWLTDAEAYAFLEEVGRTGR